jgi:hypothetical protein
MRFLILAIFSLSLLFYVSCNNGDTPGSYFEAPLPNELKDYTYFKDSTYWVYQDSASGDLDSFFVYDSKDIFSNYIDNTGKPLANMEVFQYFTNSSHDGFTYYYLTDLIANRYNDFPKVRILRVREKAGNNIINHFFNYPMEVGKFDTYGNSLLTLTKRADTMTFLQTYKDVLVYRDTDNATENNDSTTFYVAKNVGIIRKELHTSGKVWNLLRYRIVQ